MHVCVCVCVCVCVHAYEQYARLVNDGSPAEDAGEVEQMSGVACSEGGVGLRA